MCYFLQVFFLFCCLQALSDPLSRPFFFFFGLSYQQFLSLACYATGVCQFEFCSPRAFSLLHFLSLYHHHHLRVLIAAHYQRLIKVVTVCFLLGFFSPLFFPPPLLLEFALLFAAALLSYPVISIPAGWEVLSAARDSFVTVIQDLNTGEQGSTTHPTTSCATRKEVKVSDGIR